MTECLPEREGPTVGALSLPLQIADVAGGRGKNSAAIAGVLLRLV